MAARVLIVDDVEAIRGLLRMTLELEFDVVGEAADGLEAVERARELRPDVVVLDLNMPVHDGLEAIPLLIRDVPGVKVCVLTGLATDAVGTEVYALGAHAYVEKGTDLGELVSVLRDLVGR